MHDYEMPPSESFAHIKILSSHEIQYRGMGCKVLRITQDIDVLTQDSIIVCEENNVIYFVDYDSLKVLYDFNLVKGDTFYFSFPQQLFTGFYEEYVDEYAKAIISTAAIVVDVDSVLVDGNMLKRQIIDPLEYRFVTTGNTITERIGNNAFLFPFFSVDFAEINPGSDLIKYKDKSIEVVNAHMFCQVTGILEVGDVKETFVFPNPIADHFRLNCMELAIRKLLIYDSKGQLVDTKTPNLSCMYDISYLDIGVYFLRILTTNGDLYVATIIKL